MAMYLGSNKVEIGASSGGGSSDFSTAEVTVINNTGHNNGLAIPTICEANELGEGSPAMILNTMVCPSGETTRRVCLYKGLAYCSGVFPPASSITTSGNITIDENDNVNITSDCTITIRGGK